jgi:FlaA1/EpsC-like NDP-sugar epimerase
VRIRPISRRIVGQVAIDLILVVASNVAAFLLKYNPDKLYGEFFTRTLLLLPVLIAFRLTALGLFSLYRIRWRYMSLYDLKLVAGATTVSSLAFYGVLWALGYGGQGSYSWGMQIVDWVLNVCLLSGVRILYRQLSDRSLVIGGIDGGRPRQRALIVGAGDAGEATARELLRRPQEGLVPIGFIDDDPLKKKLRIHGLPVLGTTHDIVRLTEKHSPDLILIAIPSASGKILRDIVARCESASARLCIIPALPDVLAHGGTRLGPVRSINIEDLLRRATVSTDMRGIAEYISGQRVLVTGAGGSIGSELCRQIAALNPARLLILGRGENSIFEIEQELIRDFGFAPTAIIADIKDRDRIEEVFLHERPSVVFHAAAHKHVPLMEANPAEAIKNNVLGTKNVAEIAAACGVRKFLYVSTDKAVNPTSVMGATKRIGERIIRSLALHSGTEFAVVRFGNVLGSRGSVIPTMRKQIERGGPVTVTDPSMTRYFMTIPEAVQLILQAGALGRRGDVYLLDMGEPVRILDLARDLIRLSGLRPEVDIKIEFTGARPGEKIEEELLYDEEERLPTPHPKIFASASSDYGAGASFLSAAERLIHLAEQGERDRLRDEIMAVATFALTPPRPSEEYQGVPTS